MSEKKMAKSLTILSSKLPNNPHYSSSVSTCTQSFSASLKAVPLRLDGSTKLNTDGIDFELWWAKPRELFIFIPDNINYLHYSAVLKAKWFLEDMGNGINSIIHWTINQKLVLRIQKGNPLPGKRMAELKSYFPERLTWTGSLFYHNLCIFHMMFQRVPWIPSLYEQRFYEIGLNSPGCLSTMMFLWAC